MNVERRKGGETSPDAGHRWPAGGQPVRVIELGILGSSIEHDAPIVGSTDRLILQWQGQEITIPCALVHTRLIVKANDGARDERSRYCSGIA